MKKSPQKVRNGLCDAQLMSRFQTCNSRRKSNNALWPSPCHFFHFIRRCLETWNRKAPSRGKPPRSLCLALKYSNKLNLFCCRWPPVCCAGCKSLQALNVLSIMMKYDDNCDTSLFIVHSYVDTTSHLAAHQAFKALRIECLLETDRVYPKNAGVLHARWKPMRIPTALTPISHGQLHQSLPSPVPGDLGKVPFTSLM